MKKLLSLLALCAAAITQAEVVVVGNPAAPAMDKSAIADVYLGKSNSATPLDQPESAPIRAEFYQKATGKDLSQVKALWSRLSFSGKGQPPKELPDAAAVKKAIAADPKAIGYIDKAAVDSSVKVLVDLN